MRWVIILLAIALVVVMGALAVNMKMLRKLSDGILRREATMAVYKEKNDMYEQWLKLIYSGQAISKYLNDCGYEHIAIYGLGEAGKLLLKELDKAKIPINYIIEPNFDRKDYKGHLIKKNFEKLKESDVVIITEFADYTNVMEKLEALMDCPVIALDDLLFSIGRV